MRRALERLLFAEERGRGARLASAVLLPVSVVFGIAIRIRSALYDAGLLPSWRAPVPVISVGNLTLGGTGKTPLVIWIAERLAARGARPGVLLRGYGARRGRAPRIVVAPGARTATPAGGSGDLSGDAERERESDEALLLAARLPGAVVVAGRDRARAARLAVAAGATVLLLDDGFQHRALARDLDILLLDPCVPPGCGRLLPAGTLREPWSGARRAGLLAVVDGPGAAGPDGRPFVRAARRAVGVRGPGGGVLPATVLRGRRAFLLTGVGRPEGVRRLVASEGATIVGEAVHPDHHRFSAAELRSTLDGARGAGAELVVTTEKDAARLPAQFLSREEVRVLVIDLALLEGEEFLARALEEVLHAAPQ